MSNIDKQALRDIAEKTKIAGEAPVMPFEQRINALNDFMKHFTPATALALLDELDSANGYASAYEAEKWHYHGLAESEGERADRAEKQVEELTMWIKRLAHSLRNARPDSKLHGAAMDYLSRNGLISVEDVLR